MSFDLDEAGGYGSGKLGDVTISAPTFLNAYGAASNFSGKTLVVEHKFGSTYCKWDDCIGSQVLIHAIACKNGATSRGYLGRWLVATITDSVKENDSLIYNITLDKSLAGFSTGQTSYYWQAILIPEFQNLTLNAGAKAQPVPATLVTNDDDEIIQAYGGVVAFKCKGTLTLSGGHVNLQNYGFYPTNITTTQRPDAAQENNGTLDADSQSGCENFIAKNKILVNAGDGACFIMAKAINSSDSTSRIGNPDTSGVQYCRGATDSANTPANATNIGGSVILVACDSWTSFTPAVIAKYRTSETPGRGLARAYLAINSPGNNFLPDEGLYALDCTSISTRVKERFNISGFGNGQTGNFNISAARKCWNQYATVTAISDRVYTLSKRTLDLESPVDWTVGALVMIHQTRKSSGTDYQDGNFKISRITAISGDTVTIKHDFSFNLSTYNIQMIVVPEFNNLTFSGEYNNTPAYENGCGGIFAIAVKGTCDLSDGRINVEGKGTNLNAPNTMLNNYYMKRGLPLGKGHGSVFILAKNLTMNTSTRLGATQDGASMSNYANYGGYRSGRTLGSRQGAHVLIVADKVEGFNLSAISTGGGSAGAGYGTADGVSGAAFVYCNEVVDQVTTGIIA